MSVRFQGVRDLRVLLFSAVLGCALFAHASSAQSLPTAVDTDPADGIVGAHLMTAASGWVWKVRHILWTNTAGRTWSDITPPLKANQNIDGVYFLDADHGWAELQDNGIVTDTPELPDSLLVSVAATADGGKSWSEVSIENTHASYYTGGTLSFVDDKHGWMLMEAQLSSAASGGDLFSTGDGGTTWSLLPSLRLAAQSSLLPMERAGLSVGCITMNCTGRAMGATPGCGKFPRRPSSSPRLTVSDVDGCAHDLFRSDREGLFWR